MRRVVKAYGPGIGSNGRVTLEHPTDPLTEETYDRLPNGGWYLWWKSTYGNGHGVPRQDVTDPGLLALLNAAIE